MTTTTKKRPLPKYFARVSYKVYRAWYNQTSTASAQPLTVNGTQVTVSEGHPRPRRKLRVSDGDIGGNFFTQKQYIVGNCDTSISFNYPSGPNGPARFTGTVRWSPLIPSLGTFPPAGNSTNSQLDKFGATAVSRCKPTKSPASLSTALGELYKDRLPGLPGVHSWKDRTSAARKIPGDEFLNVQFGWRPLIRDIRSTANSVIESDKLTSQYLRDVGKPVRRDYRFPTERSVSNEVSIGSNSESMVPFDSYFDSGSPKQTYYVDSKTTERWFEGVFTYGLPYTERVLGPDAAAASKVLGIELTPDVVWNLAPWSWAVDWFSNTGDVVSNLSDWATNGLVMRYGYIMEHTIATRTYYTKGTRFTPFAGSAPPPLSFITETKIRRRANPFGFGLSWTGLSPIQLAIAAALGISRS